MRPTQPRDDDVARPSSCADEGDALPSGEDTAAATCFVCTGDASSEPLLTDVCACRCLAVHASCQQMLIQRTPAYAHGICSVCKEPYKNIKYVWRPKVRVRRLSSEEDSVMLKAMIIPVGVHSISALALDHVSLSLLPVYALCYAGLWALHHSWDELWHRQAVVT